MTSSEAVTFGFADEEVAVEDPQVVAAKAEKFKASLLERFKKVETVKPAASTNVLNRFKK